MKDTEKFKKFSSRWYTYTMLNLKRIESTGNTTIKDLVRLRDGKGPDGLLFIEGMNIVVEAVRSHCAIRELFVTAAFLAKRGGDVEELNVLQGKLTVISDAVAKKLSETKAPQGIYAVVEYRLKGLREMRSGGSSVIPVLDRIQDPGNLGSIIRTADAFDCKAIIILEGTCSPFNQKAIRSSAGSIFHLDVALSSEEELLKWKGKHGFQWIVMDPQAKDSLQKVISDKCLLIFGNEGGGISPFLKRHADNHARIAIPGKAESLNVSITAAIALYESTRGK